MKDTDDEQLISMFDTAIRNQFSGGAIATILGVVTVAIIFLSQTIPAFLAAGVFGFFAVKQVTDYRKQASRDRETLKEHIHRYYIPSSIALRKVINDAN